MQNILTAVKRAVSGRQYLVITVPKSCDSIHIISGGRDYKFPIFFEEKPIFSFFQQTAMYTCLQEIYVAETNFALLHFYSIR